MFKATRWGIALWFIYEQNDFILRFNRVIRQLKECQNLYKYMLLTHTIQWFYLKFYCYYKVIIIPVFIHAFYYDQDNIKILWLTRAFFFGLFSLSCLNMKWTIELLNALYHKFMYNTTKLFHEDQKRIYT